MNKYMHLCNAYMHESLLKVIKVRLQKPNAIMDILFSKHNFTPFLKCVLYESGTQYKQLLLLCYPATLLNIRRQKYLNFL